MQYFFQETFISKVKNLLKNNSYKFCELAIIECVFNLPIEQVFVNCVAQRLNPSAQNPIAKLRISYNSGKSSSFRLYVFAIIKNEKLYFAYLYPKTGKFVQSSLKANEEIAIIKELLENIKDNNVQEVFLDVEKNKICFKCDNSEVF